MGNLFQNYEIKEPTQDPVDKAHHLRHQSDAVLLG